MIELSLTPSQWITACVILGLCTGSFLNVVAWRLPIMLENQWNDELSLANGQEPPTTRPTFNLALPGSHCPHCKTSLKWHHNIPAVSWLLLRGHCAFCNASIPIRYWLVEMLCGAVFGALAWHHPPSLEALALMCCAATLLVLALIDLDTFLLPDLLTQPLVWAGLMANLIFHYVPLEQAVLGACAGYLVLWAIYKLFKALTGKEGMGYGDFKLLAALGAWFGIQSLLSIVLIASLSGIVFGLVFQFLHQQEQGAPFPFGPCLVFGGFTWMFGIDFSEWLLMLY